MRITIDCKLSIAELEEFETAILCLMKGDDPPPFCIKSLNAMTDTLDALHSAMMQGMKND